MSSLPRPDLRAVADAISTLGPVGRVTVACYLVILVAVVVDLAAAGLHREPLPRARVRSLLVTISVALVLAPPFAWIVALLWSALGSLAPPSLVHVWGAFPALAFVACFVVVDAVAYLYHWVGHHTRVGWASHRVHHLGETFDMTLVLRQPWLPVHGLVIIPLTALAGFPFADGGRLLRDLDRLPGAATHEPELEPRTVGRSVGVGSGAPTAPCRRQRRGEPRHGLQRVGPSARHLARRRRRAGCDVRRGRTRTGECARVAARGMARSSAEEGRAVTGPPTL